MVTIPIRIEDLLRRLVLIGVPLLAANCSGSSCPDDPQPSDRYVEIENPARPLLDGGMPRVTALSYQRCVDTLDCTPLCMEHFQPFIHVESCQRVATEAFASGEERVAVQAKVIPICVGRRPEGQLAAPPPARPRCDVGAYLARAAFLEGISVPAFRRLARELDAHGAPTPLVRQALQAAYDEIRHRKTMTALARRHGAEPPPIPIAVPLEVRPLEAVAIENAAEGCVRETLGAVIAREQAVRAADPAIAAALRMIARDEAQHAELAFRVHLWSAHRLGAAGRRRVEAAVSREVETVSREVEGSSVSAALMHDTGLLSPSATRRLAAGLGRALTGAVV
jgi:hypothetical protein